MYRAYTHPQPPATAVSGLQSSVNRTDPGRSSALRFQGRTGPRRGRFPLSSHTKTSSYFLQPFVQQLTRPHKPIRVLPSGSTWAKMKTDVTMGFNPGSDSCRLPFCASQAPRFNNSLETGFSFSNTSQLPGVLPAGASLARAPRPHLANCPKKRFGFRAPSVPLPLKFLFVIKF